VFANAMFDLFAMPADSELSIPVWIKYLRRTMMEESHSSPNVIHIFQTIVRHADLLYCARAHFATHVRSSICANHVCCIPVSQVSDSFARHWTLPLCVSAQHPGFTPAL